MLCVTAHEIGMNDIGCIVVQSFRFRKNAVAFRKVYDVGYILFVEASRGVEEFEAVVHARHMACGYHDCTCTAELRECG